MKRPRPNPNNRKVPPQLAPEPFVRDPKEYVAHVRYIGSGEHKSAPWPGIAPAARKDANQCPPHLTPAQATDMLKTGILSGNISEDFVGEFPKRVWYKGRLGIFAARLTDRGDIGAGKPAGYKGWPETLDKLPSQPREVRHSDAT